MPQLDNGIRGKPRAGVGKRDGADFRRRDGHKDKKGRGSHRREGGGGVRIAFKHAPNLFAEIQFLHSKFIVYTRYTV